MPKLTETFARKAPNADKGTCKFWDSEVKGLALFTGKRAKTWYYQRDVAGRTKRILIGRWPTISAEAARQAAQSMALDMSRGAGKSFAIGAPTLEDALERYLARPKLRSEVNKAGVRAQIQLHLKDWMRMPLDEITRGMVAARHADLAAKPSAANHVMRSFRSVWNHARRTCELSETPTIAIEWFPEQPSFEIIEDLRHWRALVDDLPNPIQAAFYRLLLFTGLRKTEALTLRWKNVHADRIHLPETKNGRSFDLPILPIHQDILEPVRGLSREWVFPSPKAVSGHLSNPQRLQWSLHAHRRTFATVAAEAGVLEEIVGRLLNHTPMSVTGQRYARPSIEALRPAMEAVCDALARRSGRDTV